jgi:hypothetical protein
VKNIAKEMDSGMGDQRGKSDMIRAGGASQRQNDQFANGRSKAFFICIEQWDQWLHHGAANADGYQLKPGQN